MYRRLLLGALVASALMPVASAQAHAGVNRGVAPVSHGLGSAVAEALGKAAFNRTMIVMERKWPKLQEWEVRARANQVMKIWKRSRRLDCRWPLTASFFCPSDSTPSYGVGVAQGYEGHWAPAYRGGEVPTTVAEWLRPGYLFWLRCWATGATMDNGVWRSSVWYRLTDGYWVNATWMYTGYSRHLPNVGPC